MLAVLVAAIGIGIGWGAEHGWRAAQRDVEIGATNDSVAQVLEGFHRATSSSPISARRCRMAC